jgi:hypothetical protein
MAEMSLTAASSTPRPAEPPDPLRITVPRSQRKRETAVCWANHSAV